jgi:hypothetical protein
MPIIFTDLKVLIEIYSDVVRQNEGNSSINAF